MKVNNEVIKIPRNINRTRYIQAEIDLIIQLLYFCQMSLRFLFARRSFEFSACYFLKWSCLGLFISIFSFTSVYPQDQVPLAVDSNKTEIIAFDNPPSDSTLTSAQIRKRVRAIAITNIVAYSGAMVGLYAAWYSNYEKTGFHSFNDSREWLQMDKVGHLYSAYAESVASMEFWRWTGIERKKRIWLGGMSGAAYQTVIEVLDGFSEGWGWSWADFGANIIGSGALVAQELAWDDQRIKFKFSFNRKQYEDDELNVRSDELFGKSNPERYLKDYNGQTYWASVNIASFMPRSKWPPWLAVAVGYGAEGMFGGTENIGKDDDGNINFYRPDIKRYRQWFLAPDLDLSKIKTRSKALKIALSVLNVFKFPAPSLELSRGRLGFHWIHF